MQNDIFSQDSLLERLESIRIERGESKAAFYGESGAGRSMPDNLKKKTYPSIEKIVALANHTGLSIDYLVGRSDNPSATYPTASEWAIILDQLSDDSLIRLKEQAELLLLKQSQYDQTKK